MNFQGADEINLECLKIYAKKHEEILWLKVIKEYIINEKMSEQK